MLRRLRHASPGLFSVHGTTRFYFVVDLVLCEIKKKKIIHLWGFAIYEKQFLALDSVTVVVVLIIIILMIIIIDSKRTLLASKGNLGIIPLPPPLQILCMLGFFYAAGEKKKSSFFGLWTEFSVGRKSHNSILPGILPSLGLEPWRGPPPSTQAARVTFGLNG